MDAGFRTESAVTLPRPALEIWACTWAIMEKIFLSSKANENRVCGWDINNNVLCIPLPTIFTTQSKLDLNICSCTIVKQCMKNLDPAHTAELYCNKQRMSKDTWPKLFSNPTEHLPVQHILRAEVLKDRNKLEQSTFVPSRDMTPLQRLFYYQKLFSGSSCHEEAGDLKCGL